MCLPRAGTGDEAIVGRVGAPVARQQAGGSILGGYAFARIQFKGRSTLFLMYLGMRATCVVSRRAATSGSSDNIGRSPTTSLISRCITTTETTCTARQVDNVS